MIPIRAEVRKRQHRHGMRGCRQPRLLCTALVGQHEHQDRDQRSNDRVVDPAPVPAKRRRVIFPGCPGAHHAFRGQVVDPGHDHRHGKHERQHQRDHAQGAFRPADDVQQHVGDLQDQPAADEVDAREPEHVAATQLPQYPIDRGRSPRHRPPHARSAANLSPFRRAGESIGTNPSVSPALIGGPALDAPEVATAGRRRCRTARGRTSPWRPGSSRGSASWRNRGPRPWPAGTTPRRRCRALRARSAPIPCRAPVDH